MLGSSFLSRRHQFIYNHLARPHFHFHHLLNFCNTHLYTDHLLSPVTHQVWDIRDLKIAAYTANVERIVTSPV